MTDETTNTEDSAPAETPTIRDMVRERLGNLGDRSREQVIEHFAAKEADKQANALIKGLDTLDGYERDLAKIKATPAGFDSDGKPVGDFTFTKEQADERKKLNEKIEKLARAINKADDKNDFGDLYNLTK